MAWQGEVFKAVIFPSSGEFDAGSLWTDIVGSTPPNTQKTGLPPQFHSLASGNWDEVLLQVVVQVGRIEAALTAIDPAPTEPTPMPTLPGEQIEKVIALARRAAGVFSKRMPTQRIAAHLQFVEDVTSEREATERLNALLGDVFTPSTTGQLYQINAAKPLDAIQGGKMNRLVKWGAVSLTQVTVAVTGGVASQGPSGQPRDLVFMHLDINNALVGSPMTQLQAEILTEELWDEATRIFKEGPNVLS